jgi:hypothetical protein
MQLQYISLIILQGVWKLDVTIHKDYLCYHLWDRYLEFESSQKQLNQLATIYINTLKFPTKKLHMYYEIH